jgi:hypothetical protein
MKTYGGWAGYTYIYISDLGDMERREILPLLRLELRPLGRPASRYTD